MEAARLWARGEFKTDEDHDRVLDEQDKALAPLGLYIDRSGGRPVLDPFYIWPENEEAWWVFMSCGALWRTGMAGRDGLDYPGVEILIRDICRVRVRNRRQRMREVHLMATAALEEWELARPRAE